MRGPTREFLWRHLVSALLAPSYRAASGLETLSRGYLGGPEGEDGRGYIQRWAAPFLAAQSAGDGATVALVDDARGRRTVRPQRDAGCQRRAWLPLRKRD